MFWIYTRRKGVNAWTRGVNFESHDDAHKYLVEENDCVQMGEIYHSGQFEFKIEEE